MGAPIYVASSLTLVPIESGGGGGMSVFILGDIAKFAILYSGCCHSW